MRGVRVAMYVCRQAGEVRAKRNVGLVLVYRLSSFCLARPVPRYLLVSRNGKEALCQWGAYVGGVDVVCFPFR